MIQLCQPPGSGSPPPEVVGRGRPGSPNYRLVGGRPAVRRMREQQGLDS